MHISKLKAVEIEINSACNKACSYCPNSVAERIEQGHMAPALFNKIVSQLQDIKFKGRISFDFYNEPTLSPNLLTFIETLTRELPKCQVHLYSNGSLITKAFFDKLITAGVAKFIITKHEDHVQNSKPYIFEKTLAELSDIERQKVEYRDFNQINLTNRGGSLEHIKSKVEDIQKRPCYISMFLVSITLQGNVLPCFEDFYQKMAMGNINQEHIRDIWNKPKYIRFRKMLMMGQRKAYSICENCTRTEVVPEGNIEHV